MVAIRIYCNQCLIYVAIFVKTVPPEGRHITRLESKHLQAQGISCSERWKVCGSEKVGVLFRRLANGMYKCTGIEVKVRRSTWNRYRLYDL